MEIAKRNISHYRVMMKAEERGLLQKYNDLVFHKNRNIEQVCEELGIPIDGVIVTSEDIFIERWEKLIESIKSDTAAAVRALDLRQRSSTDSTELTIIASLLNTLDTNGTYVENAHIDESCPRFTLLTELPHKKLPAGLYYLAKTNDLEGITRMIEEVLRKDQRYSGWLATRNFSAQELQLEYISHAVVDTIYESNINPITVKGNVPVIMGQVCYDGTQLFKLIPLFQALRKVRKIHPGVRIEHAMREVFCILQDTLNGNAEWRTVLGKTEVYMDMRNDGNKEKVVEFSDRDFNLNIVVDPNILNLIFALYGENALD